MFWQKIVVIPPLEEELPDEELEDELVQIMGDEPKQKTPGPVGF